MAEAKSSIKVSPKSNNQPKSIGNLWLLLACFAFGFLGGFVAIRTDSNDIHTAPSTQVILKESEAIAEVAERVSKSVVSVLIEEEVVSNDLFFGPQSYEAQGEGSGVILSEDGIVLTNKHVIPEGVTSITIVTSDGTEYKDVEVLGRDPLNDVAFLKIKGAKDLVPATLGDSSKIKIGDKAIAIGNALGEFDNTVTAGIISGIGRPIVAGSGVESEQLQNLFQTDAAINPGNSGGPLVNINGEVIGINTAVAGEGQGIGFAIPSNDVKSGFESIKKTGELKRPYLGVRYVTLTKEIAKTEGLKVEEGAYITADQNTRAILKESPAQKAGLMEGDVITKVNDDAVNSTNLLVTLVSKYQVGETIKLSIQRGDQQLTKDVKLEAVPESFTNN